ncbi:MAG: hypothetical protein ACK2U9_14505, partial [Anaerolineae bacterium]
MHTRDRPGSGWMLLSAALVVALAPGARAQPVETEASGTAAAQRPVRSGTASTLRFEIIVHVASSAPGDTEGRLKRLLDEANRHFAAAGICFRSAETRVLPVSYAVLETIRERRRLMRYLVPRVINVFLVDEILDPHPSMATVRASAWQGRKPSNRLGGAHIESKGHVPDTYIVLSRAVADVTLTHELGHFFGVAHHRDPGNIM